jgi:hypothetical protein
MKASLIFTLIFVFLGNTVSSKNFIQNFDKPAFYSILKSGKIAEVNEELTLLATLGIAEKEAYTGVLLMKKAGLVKLPPERLKLFKKGRLKLETAILNDNDNGEYHFLRLAIQERAPKIVKYSNDEETDKMVIKRTFKRLSPAVQQAIVDYSKTSKIIGPQDFN